MVVEKLFPPHTPIAALAVPGQEVGCTIAAPVPALHKGLSMSISVRR